jgi:NAD(P)-dependent dehydrogenase (short-subunit alcohol dehydrogenase family)
MVKIAIVDGKGGGLGAAIAKKLASMKDVEIVALGTNSQATGNMLKNGARDGATGENAICHMAEEVDIIVGPMALVVANSMMGEITPKVARAVAGSKARKILLPTQKCGVDVVGVNDLTMAQLIELVPEKIAEFIK